MSGDGAASGSGSRRNEDGSAVGSAGYGRRYHHTNLAESSDPADDVAENVVFPDAQLKLAFPHIKIKLQERLAQRHAAASMESHQKGA
eukprot:SAG31_NODE_44174_length_264_cov_0.600000_1_plen_87_part_11